MQANWSGDIPNGTVWTNNEVQRVVGDVRIPQGATLTVQPGTVIKFNSGTDMFVDGTLTADGDAGSKIYFTALRDDCHTSRNLCLKIARKV